MLLLKEKQKDGRNIDTRTQKFSILFRNIFVFLCKLTPPETPLGSCPCSKHPSDILYQSQIGCFVMYIKVFIVRLRAAVCDMFLPVTKKNVWICGKNNLFISTAQVYGDTMRLSELLKETQMDSSH